MISLKSRPWRLCAGVGFFVLAAHSHGALAADYNYLDAAYLKLDSERDEAESSGFRLRISAPLDQGQFMRASYGRLKTDDGIRSSVTRVGLGINSAASGASDVYFLLSYEDVDNKASAGDKGYSAELGLSFGSEGLDWQLDLAGRYTDLDHAGDRIDWRAEANYRLTPTMALSAAYSLGEDADRVEAGLRFFSAQR